MTNVTTKSDSFEPATDTAAHLFDNWFDPIEIGVRERVREFIEALIRGELDAVLARPRYGRAKNDDACPAGIVGHRHGSRTRSLTGSFGKTEITVPRARLQTSEGGTTEWHSKALRTYQRRTLTADALIAGAYLAGTNTRRVRRALAALFRGAVSKDIVSRVWRKIKSDWDFWSARSLAAEPIVRLILDGTVVRVRLDRKATSISLLVVIGVREDGQKVLLAVKNMGGESAEAWRSVLDDLIERGLRRPAFLIVDGAPGSERATSTASSDQLRVGDQLDQAVPIAVDGRDRAAEQARRAVEDRLEHRRDVGRRLADDAQHVADRHLVVERLAQLARALLDLAQRLARLVEEAHVLDRDHRLVGEDLQQPDVLLGEDARLLATTPIEPMTSPSRIIGTARLLR